MVTIKGSNTDNIFSFFVLGFQQLFNKMETRKVCKTVREVN